MSDLNPVDIEILMKLQYEFPLSPTPFRVVADKIGLDEKEVIKRLERLKAEGILKRVGFYLNFRATGLVGALVAIHSKGQVEKIARLFNQDPLVSHNFLRDYPDYDVWLVIKARGKEELLSKVNSLIKQIGVDKYIVLFSKKILKLSVKYDLIEGVSRSGPWSHIVEDPPRPEDLGIPAKLLFELRSLPLEKRPYKNIAHRHKLSEEELVELVREMLAKGLLGDPGVALEGHKVGFVANGMVVVADDELNYVCEKIAFSIPEATHVVLREPYPPGTWKHNCYFMVHARNKELLENIVSKRLSDINVNDYKIIYSIKDLKPRVIR